MDKKYLVPEKVVRELAAGYKGSDKALLEELAESYLGLKRLDEVDWNELASQMLGGIVSMVENGFPNHLDPDPHNWTRQQKEAYELAYKRYVHRLKPPAKLDIGEAKDDR